MTFQRKGPDLTPASEVQTEWRRKNPEAFAAIRLRWRQNHPEKVRAANVKSWASLTPEQKKARVKRAAEWCKANPERARASRLKTHAKVKQQVIEAYGSRCECCKESDPIFLTIDHVGGGGKAHRQKVGQLYNWLRKNNFPKEGFRLLCMNCNWAVGIFGRCPHGGLQLVKTEKDNG